MRRVTPDTAKGVSNLWFSVSAKPLSTPTTGPHSSRQSRLGSSKGEAEAVSSSRVAQGDLTVRVPAENAEIVGVREVVGEEGLTKVFDVLRAPHTEEPTNWSRRYKANLEKLASGNPSQGGGGRSRPLAP